MADRPFNASLALFAATGSVLILTACGQTLTSEAKYPTGDRRSAEQGEIYKEEPGIFGKEGLSILGGKKSEEASQAGIGVNGFLWRAALDTVSFMPLASADPFGGVILTDWHMPDGNEKERFKVNVFILGRELRSDGVRVRVFKQTLSGGNWKDSAASDETARQLEDTILTRARQLRLAQIGRE